MAKQTKESGPTMTPPGRPAGGGGRDAQSGGGGENDRFESRPVDLSPEELARSIRRDRQGGGRLAEMFDADDQADVRIVVDPATADRTPMSPRGGSAAAGDRDGGVRFTSNDVYGANSLQAFAEAGGLSHTHEDAQGFIDFLGGTGPANYWFRDAGVQPWQYIEQYDDWLDTYGADAVWAFYHSGHGGMDGNGVFYAPLGAAWGNKSPWFTSDDPDVKLGNEEMRYIYFSTCLSCRVLDGQNPIRTWFNANAGFRMLSGFETVSWDDPNYGKYFGEEWRKGQSLSDAWLNASWRIAHDQAPSVVACGATAEEAQNTLWHERYYSHAPASKAWWWWRWYSASTASAGIPDRDPNRAPPRDLLVADLQRPEPPQRRLRALAARLGARVRVPAEVPAARDGTVALSAGDGPGDAALSIAPDGSVDARLAAPNRENRSQLAPHRAAAIARDAVRSFGLDRDASLVFDRVRLSAEAGGTGQGTGRIEGPTIAATTVQFRQVINGLPVITPSAGAVRVTLDNDGKVTEVHDSTRAVRALVDRPRGTVAAPPTASNGGGGTPGPRPGPAARIAAPRAADAAGYEQLLARAWNERLTRWVVAGRLPEQFVTVPGSTEVGYDIRGDQAVIVARRAVEVDFGNGLRKRYWVVTPILE